MEQQQRISTLSGIVVITLLLSLGNNGFASPKKDYKGEILALPCHQPSTLKDGIYFGLGVGYDAYRIRQNIDLPVALGTVDQANPPIAANSFLGNAFLGYGRQFNWFYMAGELAASYSGASTHYSINQYRTSFSIRDSYSASILPGILVNPAALFYARIGYMRSFMKAQETLPTTFNIGTTHWGNAMNYGLGLETVVYKRVSMRGEYTYTNYDSFHSLLKTSFAPSNNQFTLSMLYHFDYL
jgi:opacity protein-like surface antigen